MRNLTLTCIALAGVLALLAVTRAAADSTPLCLGEPATIVGTENNDALSGTSGDDVIVGLGGDDLIRADRGNDVICGGDGNDMIQGSNGGPFVDLMSGDAGDDTIDGGSPVGGIVSYAEAPAGVQVHLWGITTGWGSDRLLRVESVIGSQFDDTIAGDNAANEIVAMGGNDLVTAGGGADTIYADDGNDKLNGGLSPLDTISFELAPHAVSVDLGTQRARGLGNDAVVGFEHVRGSRFGDRLSGSAATNLLIGGGGNDVLTGRSGRDLLVGLRGRDFADGGAGVDACSAERTRRCP